MTTPSQSSEREETVQALASVIHRVVCDYPSHPAGSYDSEDLAQARAVVASAEWQQLEHEALGLAARLTEARAERDQAIRERDEAREAVARVEALLSRGESSFVAKASVRAALSGGAGEQATCDLDWLAVDTETVQGRACRTCGAVGAL